MKKLPYAVIIVGFIDIMFFFPIIWLIAVSLCGISFVSPPPSYLRLSFKNAPENTAYIDLLVEMDTGDSVYVPFTEPPRKRTGTSPDGSAVYETLNIDESSAVTTLNDGGLVSFSLHYSESTGVLILDNGSMLFTTRNYFMPIPGVPDEDARIKAAYVDKNGNVLGITDAAKSRYVGGSGYVLRVDGDRLVIGYPGRPSWISKAAVVVLFAVEGRALAGLALFIVLAIVSVCKPAKKLSDDFAKTPWSAYRTPGSFFRIIDNAASQKRSFRGFEIPQRGKENTRKKWDIKKIPFIKPIVILAVCVVLVIPALFNGLFILYGAGTIQCFFPLSQFMTSYENAPERTVRIEPLIKLSEDDENYIPADFDTEIARFRDNGYVSLLHHYAYCVYDSETYAIVPKDKYRIVTDLIERYGAFKAAYVDENGNVLGVTKAARIHWGNNGTPRLMADGDRLAFYTGCMADWQNVILLIVFLAEPAAALTLIVFIVLAIVTTVKRKRERSVQ